MGRTHYLSLPLLALFSFIPMEREGFPRLIHPACGSSSDPIASRSPWPPTWNWEDGVYPLEPFQVPNPFHTAWAKESLGPKGFSESG